MTIRDYLEILQWTLLLGTGLLVLGCYRQLGLILLEGRDVYRNAFGPKVGQPVPRKWRFLFSNLPKAPWSIIAFTRNECRSCDEVYAGIRSEILEATSKPLSEVTVATVVAPGADEAYLTKVGANLSSPRAVVAAHTAALPNDPPPGGFPMLFLIDARGVVREKILGTDLPRVLSRIAGAETDVQREAQMIRD